MGVGQRLTRRAAHIGGVIVVDRADLVNRALVPVYHHLGYEWDPAVTGSLAAETPVTVAETAEALITALADRGRIEPGRLDQETLAAARSLASDHLPG